MSLRSLLAAAAAFATSVPARAHGGHGALGDWHWHASDTFGFLLVGGLAALAVWWSSRGGK